MEHTKHLWRLGGLLILMMVGSIVGRHFVIPDSFGEMGYYRYDALFEFMDKEPLHGGADACAACHDDVAETKAAGAHAAVQCEVCHDTLASHIKDDDKFADMAVQRSFELCAKCHQHLRARPADMAQIVLADHLAEQADLAPGRPIPPEACLDCHESHRP